MPSLRTEPWSAGTVREASLRDLWERGEPMRRLRDHTAADLWGFCKSCYYAGECLGGCTWTADAWLGRSGNNPFCHHRALELAARGSRERLVPVAPAPGAPFDRATFDLIVEPAARGQDPHGGPSRPIDG